MYFRESASHAPVIRTGSPYSSESFRMLLPALLSRIKKDRLMPVPLLCVLFTA